MSTPISSEVHNLLVRPNNSSLVLGALHHALYRPANAAVNKVIGKQIPRGFSPQAWGEAAARAGEKLDRSLSLGAVRREDIKLNNTHLTSIGDHLDTLKAKDPTKHQALVGDLNSTIANHYNNSEDIEGLIHKARQNNNFAATLHGVHIPSLTGEVGKGVKNVATDIAALYGAGEIMNKARSIAEGNQEKKGSTSMLQEAIDHLLKAASILESIPAKDYANKQARRLLEAGVIDPSELEKHASIFEKNPEDAETIVNGMLRDPEIKSATLGEPVLGDDDGPRTRGRGGFELFCVEGLSK